MIKIGVITKGGVTLGASNIFCFENVLRAIRRVETNRYLETSIIYSRYDHKSGPADVPEYLNPKFSLSEGYVLAALISPMNWGTDVSEWEFRLYSGSYPEWYDQYMAKNMSKWVDFSIPKWYKQNPEKYEQMFRDEVKHYMNKNFIFMCGHAWQPIKKGKTEIEYLYGGELEIMRFGIGNDYTTSDVRKYLQTSDLLRNLESTFGDRLSPITVDMTIDFYDSGYGKISGDYIGLLTKDEYITMGRFYEMTAPFWLATPESTPPCGSSANVKCGQGYWPQAYNSLSCHAVRPCIIIKNA